MPVTTIGRREAPDLDGDPVDLLPADVPVQYWYLQGCVEAKQLVVCVSAALAGLGSVFRRHRQLDIPLWQARLVAGDGRELDLLAVPLRAPAAVRQLLEAALGELRSSAGHGRLSQFKACPIARYEHGQVVLYKRSDAHHDQERVHGLEALPNVQWRSAETMASPPPRAPPAEASKQTFPRHDLARWARCRTELLRAIERLPRPLDAQRVAMLAERVAGVAVMTETDPRFLRLGCIRLDEVDAGRAAAVTVLINARLGAGERCVVLLHELSHYILHFPLLLEAQWVDDLSHRVPELELLFAASASRHLAGGLARLEEQANLLASALLVPVAPALRRAWLAEQMIAPELVEMPIEEWIARDLQPYFAELAAPQGWDHPAERKRLRALGTSLAAAAVDLNHASPASLLHAIFAAVRQRDLGLDIDGMAAELLPVLQALHDLRTALLAKLHDLAAPDWADAARAWLAGRITLGTLQQARDWAPSLVRKDAPAAGAGAAGELGALVSGADRELLPPPGWNQMHQLYPRQRLQPADWNPDGAADGEWVPLGQPQAPVGTLEEYFEFGPRGQGLALHRFTAWQKALLRRRTERIEPPPEWLEGLPPDTDPAALQWVLRTLLAPSPDNAQGN